MSVTTLVALAVLSPASSADTNILFLGNSHTSTHKLPEMVASLLESDGSGRRVTYSAPYFGLLNALAKNERVLDDVSSGKWDIIVLQGAMMSSSHKYKYRQDGGIQLAKLARDSGARVMLFAEWPRRNWSESEFILRHYKEIAAASGAKVIPIPYTWDLALKKNPQLDLWAADGNHSNPRGAYLAAATIYYWIAGTDRNTPSWRPSSIDAGTAAALGGFARLNWQRNGAKG